MIQYMVNYNYCEPMLNDFMFINYNYTQPIHNLFEH